MISREDRQGAAQLGARVEQPCFRRSHRNAQHPADYTYNYEVDGFFISYEGQLLRLAVRADTVRTATFVSSGIALSDARGFPTIDGLFDRARGRIVGSEHYLTKPFTKDELLSAIETHIGR